MKLSDSRKNWLDQTAEKYRAARTETLSTYLEGRGLPSETADTFRIGLVADPADGHEEFVGRLSIPFITPTGVVAMRFRCLDPHHETGTEGNCPKYRGPTGESTHLYNVQALHDADDVIAVCEGELDAIVCTTAGIPAVGIPGVQNWKPQYTRLFEDFDRVVLLGDGDTAGRKFNQDMLQILWNSESRTMPEGHDVTSFVLEYGDLDLIAHALA